MVTDFAEKSAVSKFRVIVRKCYPEDRSNKHIRKFLYFVDLHHNMSFFTNLMHKFFIFMHLLHSSTCFEHHYAHLQEVKSY